jgi:hypothetical protein
VFPFVVRPGNNDHAHVSNVTVSIGSILSYQDIRFHSIVIFLSGQNMHVDMLVAMAASFGHDGNGILVFDLVEGVCVLPCLRYRLLGWAKGTCGTIRIIFFQEVSRCDSRAEP